MKFWKKYKAKKELKKKLEKARFVNFYSNQIDLSLGRIKEVLEYSRHQTKMENFCTVFTNNYYIILRHDNFKEIFLSYGKEESIRDDHICELENFANSDKFTQYLNNYENLKREYEQL